MKWPWRPQRSRAVRELAVTDWRLDESTSLRSVADKFSMLKSKTQKLLSAPLLALCCRAAASPAAMAEEDVYPLGSWCAALTPPPLSSSAATALPAAPARIRLKRTVADAPPIISLAMGTIATSAAASAAAAACCR